jgi:hypothetical protein
LRDVFIGGGEHLKRPRDVQELHQREGQHFDDASRTGAKEGWLETRGLWHFRQSLPA